MLRTIEVRDVELETVRDFARARRAAFFGRVMGRLLRGLVGGGASERLSCFGEASKVPCAPRRCCRTFEIVETAKVSGSVGRCLDFDRGFLPVCSCLGERWRGVDRAFLEGRSLPPVELYKVGGKYFVFDGNHRVSVARYRGVRAVDAFVTEFVAGCGCSPD